MKGWHMTEESMIIKVDVRGEVCPSPLVKAMEAMKNARDDQSVEISTDFSPAVLAISNAALKTVDYKGGIDNFLKTVKNTKLSNRVKNYKKQILLKS